MKRWALETLATIAGLGFYLAWQYRKEVMAFVAQVDQNIMNQARYSKAVQRTLRSIQNLPETEERS